MNSNKQLYWLIAILFFIVGCGSTTTVEESVDTSSSEFNWNLPNNVFPPIIPSSNPITDEKVELGRYLFYDKKLSSNQTQSCESCHFQENAFADHNIVGIGSTGIHHVRNPNGLTNTAYYNSYGWADPTITTLEDFIIKPITGDTPIELGTTADKEPEVLARFENDGNYQELFALAFPDIKNPFTLEYIVKALASFARTLNSFNSPYDQYITGDKTVLTPSQIRGMNLFMGEKAECFHCHDGIHFSDSTANSKSFQNVQFFHNIGLYNLNNDGSYPLNNQGLYEITKEDKDKGKFKAPTLRNIALTNPYMHDGSIATLEEVIELHSNGGRVITEGNNEGDGTQNPYKDDLIVANYFTDEEKEDLVNFLKALTDTEFINNPKLSNPFK